jgi:hypothetical protein
MMRATVNEPLGESSSAWECSSHKTSSFRRLYSVTVQVITSNKRLYVFIEATGRVTCTFYHEKSKFSSIQVLRHPKCHQGKKRFEYQTLSTSLIPHISKNSNHSIYQRSHSQAAIAFLSPLVLPRGSAYLVVAPISIISLSSSTISPTAGIASTGSIIEPRLLSRRLTSTAI